MELCRSFAGKGGRGSWRSAWNGCDPGWHGNFRALPASLDVFYLPRVTGLNLSGGRPIFPQVPQRSAEEVLASSKLTQAAQRPLDLARGVTLSTWVSPERLGRCLRTDVWLIDRSLAEANIISTATGRRRAFDFDMREMRRRANAAYDLPAAGCRTRVPAPNTCKLARLSRAIQRGFGR